MISTLNLKKYFFLFIVLLSIISIQPVTAQSNNQNLVNIYFFHSNDCSHCQSEEKFLTTLEKEYDNIKIYRYEIHENKNNELRKSVQEIYDIKTNGVPLTIIGDTPYIGYLENKSNLIFTKTILYYSKYGYIDKVGELLQIETSSYYNIDETTPTLDEFIDTYGNYKLIGDLSTDDLDTSTTAIILGILSQFNLVKIVSIIIILILIQKIGGFKNKLCLLVFYLGISFLFNTTYLFSNQIYTLIIEIVLLLIFMLGLLGYSKNKKRQYIYSNIFIIISIISNYLETTLYPTNLKIFKELILLHNLTGLNKIVYYGNYLFITLIVNLIFIIIFYSIKKLIIKKIG